MSCWELDKNTFITMSKNGVLNILHMKMTRPILRWPYHDLTDLTDLTF